ncbi:hypothetical protein NLJ89_g4791 [Agrocybe chaxingu]|uniref:T6SS Phospholipase effector Tle1-like catalytic domain-containing protein n=1 Tax=Agrocybe chaxingu TaxID=84603 RepID=A0A9W8K1Y3_9AGAR|nr:hypothetical protein NLJ89_g4791 [Agrocybe chaxingu]
MGKRRLVHQTALSPEDDEHYTCQCALFGLLVDHGAKRINTMYNDGWMSSGFSFLSSSLLVLNRFVLSLMGTMATIDAHARLDSAISDTTLATESPTQSKFGSLNGGAATSPLPDCIPPESPSRTLVLCFDGTGDQFDSDNSNVVEFFSMLKKDDPSRQLVYYQSGIGTFTTPQIATPMFAKISKTLDEMIAWNMDSHIMCGYEFLMQNYRANDRICIFGFSRGAYTARCLAGMIHKVGLLPTCNHQQVPFAYKMYTRTDDVGWKQSNAFKKAFSIDVNIEFLGVWDTVSSVGLIPRRLPFTTSNTVVRTFRHAIALDERRAKFKANLWNRPNDNEKLLNIGGGSVENGVPFCLARIPLRWMIRECFKTNTGVAFHTDGLRDIGFDPSTLYPAVLPRPPAHDLDTSRLETSVIQSIPKNPIPSTDEDNMLVPSLKPSETEEQIELKDALSPIYDQLSLNWIWWILELLPLKHRYQRSDNVWTSWFGWNVGTGRHIPSQRSHGVRVHRSVRTRMTAEDARGERYTPKANVNLEHVIWVD